MHTPEKRGTMKELMEHIKQAAKVYLPHYFAYRWLHEMEKIDLDNEDPDTLIIQTDFAAQAELKGNDSLNSQKAGHANLDVFIVRVNPRRVWAKTKNGQRYQKWVRDNHVWRFWIPASGVNKENDWATHYNCLKHIIDFYNLAKIYKQIIIWTDGCPNQYKCRQNLLKVASFPSVYKGIKYLHCFMATAQFKGPHDGVYSVCKLHCTLTLLKPIKMIKVQGRMPKKIFVIWKETKSLGAQPQNTVSR